MICFVWDEIADLSSTKRFNFSYKDDFIPIFNNFTVFLFLRVNTYASEFVRFQNDSNCGFSEVLIVDGLFDEECNRFPTGIVGNAHMGFE